jgi:hypothetical protein
MIPPPTKRLRILVSGGVVLVISVRLYNKIYGCGACGCAYPARKFPCAEILQLEQKVAQCANQQNQLSSTYSSSESSFLKQFCALHTESTVGFGSSSLLSVSSRCTLQATCDMFMRGANESLIHLGRKDWAELIARFDIGTYIVFSNVYDIL